MTDADAFPSADVPVEAVSPADLKEWLDGGEPVRILDVRASGEFEEWHLDAESAVVENVPYFEFLEGVSDDLIERVPRGEGPLTVVCAKGGASEYVAGLLLQEEIEARNLEEGMVGWGKIYESVEVSRYQGPGMVYQYQRPSSGCLAYLVVSDGEAAVIDPLRAFADRYVEDAADHGADLVYAIDTHVHADHVSGVRRLAVDSGAEAVVPARAVARGIDYDVDCATVEDGDELQVGDATVEVLATPGHTSGMTAYRVGNVLFTGDGLFTESVARPDLEEGDEGAPAAAAQLYDTLTERVLPLPDETLVAPAHFSDAATPAGDGTYTARLGDLAERMAALSLERGAFVEFVLDDMPPRPGNFEEIIETNLGLRDVDDDEAFRMEQGPNNCAATKESIAGD